MVILVSHGPQNSPQEPRTSTRSGFGRPALQEVSAMTAGLPDDLPILLIEHDMDVVRNLARSVNVLHLGEALAESAPEEIQRDARVIDIYLGRRR
jgi:urea transport system ATP-binding protein